MRKLGVLGLLGLTMALVVAVSASSAGQVSDAPTPLAVSLASDLKPARGGPPSDARAWIPLHAKEFAAAKAAANEHAHVGGNRPRPGGGGGGTGPTVSSYPNVAPSFDGTYQSGLTPPDTTGTMGPDRYIEMVNTQYAIYSRTGSKINSGSLSSLTGMAGGFFGYSLSDPQMMWDAKTSRFYYSAVYYDAFMTDMGIAIGWSKTAAPSSSSDFCKYALGFGSSLPDYPKLGDSSDFLLVGANIFANGSTYTGSEIATLNKPSAGATCAPTSQLLWYRSGALHNADASLAATPVPANLVDDPPNGAGYAVANADLSVVPSANFISVYQVTTNGVDASGRPIPKFSGPSTVTLPSSYSMPSSAVQKGSSYLLDTLDGRFEAAVAAVDPGHGGALALWTAHAVYGGAGAEERWYELDPTAATLLQSDRVTDPSLFVWNGAVAPDRANNGTTPAFGDSMAMSVSTSSATSYPAIQFVWKKGSGSQSALRTHVQAAGASIDFSCTSGGTCRWGDYSGASPDPAATGTVGKVWLANQYNLAGGSTSNSAWRTRIFGVVPTS